LVPRITSAQQNQFGITNPSLTDISVGIILEVTPRTNPDGTIVMAINATKSSVGPEATGIPVFTDQAGNVVRSPQIPLTTAQTTVSARSGQTVILGGLITKDQAETTRRIPYLADIPALGRLFRFDSVRNQRTELLIILTPYIMQSDERNEWYNARESERMSWCLADLVNIHGPVGMGGHPAYNLEGPPLIFPDLTPAAPPASAAPAGPALPPPPQPNLYAPQQPMGAYAPPAVIVPEAGPLPAGNFGPPPPAGTLVPQTIQPAAPPAGTQAAQYAPWPPPAPPQFSPGPPIAPAQFQQPAGR
jgi:general secretion pathway protein D